MIGVLRAMVVLTALALMGGRADRGASAPTATTVAEQARGFARTDEGAFVGFHLGPQFSSTIDDRGAQLAGLDATWTMGLHVARIGRAGAMRDVGRAAPSATKGRVDIARGGGVTEWYAHRDRGLEHGIDVSAPPTGAGELVIEVAVDGRTPAAASDGRQVELRDAGGAITLTYGELSVKDADGRDVAARMGVVGDTVTLAVRDGGARYPLVVDPLVWTQQAEMAAPDGAAGEEFGYSVAVSGSTAIVGAPYNKVGSNSKQGAAYVFVKSGITWTQQAKLLAADGTANDWFGWSVAISNSTAIVGAYHKTLGSNNLQGAAYTFVQTGTTWSQQATLVSEDASSFDGFGYSVAVSGPTAIVGAALKNAAYVFGQSGTKWTQQEKLVAKDAALDDFFGGSVAVSGPTAIVGAYGKRVGSNANQGAAYVFVQSDLTWTQQARLVAADGATGDQFGFSVALSGSTAVVGAPYNRLGSSAETGAAYVFVQTGSTWTQQTRLFAKDGLFDDTFGAGVALDGSTAIVGGSLKGAYVFVRSDITWTQQAKLAAGESVALSGSTAIVGDHGKSSYRGAAYIFAFLHTNGDPCTAGTVCASGLCADAVCCDRACDGRCEACTAAKKGSGVDGTCGFVADGTDSNGKCEPPTCVAGTLTEHVCDGRGGCRPKTSACPRCSEDRRQSLPVSGAPTSCGSFLCDPATGLCAKSCNGDSDCATGNACSASHTCEPVAGAGSSTSGCGCALPGTTKDGERPWTIAGLGVLAVLASKRHRRRCPQRG